MAADQYCLKWNNHQSTLLVQFETLLESDSLTDCTLSAEGKYLNVHKVLLSACSPYFSKLLGEHKDKHPIFFMKDVAFEELKGIVEYMYKGEVNVMQERLDSFLKTASSLQIKGLADQDGGKGDEREEDPGGGRGKRKQAPDLRGGYGESSPMPEEPPRSPKRRRRPRPVSQDDSLPAQDQNHCDTTTAPPSTAYQQDVVMPTPLVPVKKTEPVDNSMVHLKTEIPDDVPQVDVQDLTLDDDEDFNNEDITQPGTSFSETSQDFAQWQQQMATQSGADESFIAATQGINQSAGSQDFNHECSNCKELFRSEPSLRIHSTLCKSDTLTKMPNSMKTNVHIVNQVSVSEKRLEGDKKPQCGNKSDASLKNEPTRDLTLHEDDTVSIPFCDKKRGLVSKSVVLNEQARFTLMPMSTNGSLNSNSLSNPVCCNRFSSNNSSVSHDDFRKHLIEVHNLTGRILKCDLCIFYTNRRLLLSEHYEQNHKQNLHLCQHCGAIFKNIRFLKVHCIVIHGYCQDIPCPFCRIRVDGVQIFKDHLFASHKDDLKPFMKKLRGHSGDLYLSKYVDEVQNALVKCLIGEESAASLANIPLNVPSRANLNSLSKKKGTVKKRRTVLGGNSKSLKASMNDKKNLSTKSSTTSGSSAHNMTNSDPGTSKILPKSSSVLKKSLLHGQQMGASVEPMKKRASRKRKTQQKINAKNVCSKPKQKRTKNPKERSLPTSSGDLHRSKVATLPPSKLPSVHVEILDAGASVTLPCVDASVTLPCVDASATLPCVVSSATIPVVGTSATLPVVGTSATLPVVRASATLPVVGTSATLPVVPSSITLKKTVALTSSTESLMDIVAQSSKSGLNQRNKDPNKMPDLDSLLMDGLVEETVMKVLSNHSTSQTTATIYCDLCPRVFSHLEDLQNHQKDSHSYQIID